MKTHGGRNTREYHAWNAMIQRCYNPNHAAYKGYGGRGITVCAEWRTDFVAFRDHVGYRPLGDYSLDRIDNNGNYEPGNVRWTTRIEQCNNRRSKREIVANGITKTITRWASDSGLSIQTIFCRLKRGWSPEDAVSYSPSFQKKRFRDIERAYQQYSIGT